MTLAGAVLGGRYVLEEKVGNGGYGEVWRATDTALSKPVAVKLLHPHYTQRSEALARFRVPLLLCRGGHFTAVSGVTAASLILFDSGGSYWVRKQACGVPGNGEELRHMIYPASFLALNI